LPPAKNRDTRIGKPTVRVYVQSSKRLDSTTSVWLSA
jgi:hypothetical protein